MDLSQTRNAFLDGFKGKPKGDFILRLTFMLANIPSTKAPQQAQLIPPQHFHAATWRRMLHHKCEINTD